MFMDHLHTLADLSIASQDGFRTVVHHQGKYLPKKQKKKTTNPKPKNP